MQGKASYIQNFSKSERNTLDQKGGHLLRHNSQIYPSLSETYRLLAVVAGNTRSYTAMILLLETGALRLMCKHIQQKQNTWYYRRRVPEDVRTLHRHPETKKPQFQLFFSLKTSDMREAARLADIETRRLDALWAHHRAGNGNVADVNVSLAQLRAAGLSHGDGRRYADLDPVHEFVEDIRCSVTRIFAGCDSNICSSKVTESLNTMTIQTTELRSWLAQAPWHAQSFRNDDEFGAETFGLHGVLDTEFEHPPGPIQTFNLVAIIVGSDPMLFE